MLLIGVPIAAFVAFITPSSYVGFWIEIFSFIVVLLSLDTIATNGRPEDRLQAGYFALLIFCFPFYATTLYFYEGLALIHSMAHAAKFVIPTLVALVLSEILWHWTKRLFGDVATDIARPEERLFPRWDHWSHWQYQYFISGIARRIDPLGRQLVGAVGTFSSPRG